jgi:hypothetical protein
MRIAPIQPEPSVFPFIRYSRDDAIDMIDTAVIITSYYSLFKQEVSTLYGVVFTQILMAILAEFYADVSGFCA